MTVVVVGDVVVLLAFSPIDDDFGGNEGGDVPLLGRGGGFLRPPCGTGGGALLPVPLVSTVEEVEVVVLTVGGGCVAFELGLTGGGELLTGGC